jgi:hypothetical protein
MIHDVMLQSQPQLVLSAVSHPLISLSSLALLSILSSLLVYLPPRSTQHSSPKVWCRPSLTSQSRCQLSLSDAVAITRHPPPDTRPCGAKIKHKPTQKQTQHHPLGTRIGRMLLMVEQHTRVQAISDFLLIPLQNLLFLSVGCLPACHCVRFDDSPM